jgi:thiamine pyrophosphokinase
MTQVVVVVGGGPLSPGAADLVEPGALVIAADSGLDHAVASGLEPTVLVGDLDSISASGTMWAYAHQVETERHPALKDATDTELALHRAAASGRDHLLVLGAIGDRVDHLLGTVSVLGSPTLASFVAVTAMIGDSVMHVVHPGRSATLQLHEGTVFSLLALHGECHGVSVTGASWPLADATLPIGSSLGISNRSIDTVHVSTVSGVVTVVVP